MIQLDTETLADQNIYTSPVTVLTHTLPASPTEHLAAALVKVSALAASVSRALMIRLLVDGQEVFNSSVLFTSDDTTNGRIRWLAVPPLPLRGGQVVTLTVQSDNSGDNDDIGIDAWLSSHDLDYILAFRAAETTPTADSPIERLKAVDAAVPGTLVADVATAVWAAGARTLTGYGTLVADVAAAAATAVWAAGARTLTGYGTLVADVAAAAATAVWAAGARTLTGYGTLVADVAAAAATAVWAAGARTLTGYGTLVADVAAAAATAVWAAGARTLTGFGTLVADVAAAAATAVWAAGARTLTGFGTLVADVAAAILSIPANKLKTNAAGQVEASNVTVLPAIFEAGDGTYTFAGATNLPFDVPQNAETAVPGQVLDGAGDPVDLSDRTVVFRVVDSAGTEVLRLTEGDGIAVAEGDDGQVTILISAADAAEAGSFKYEFWADDLLLAKGAFVVRETFGPGS